MVIRENFAKFVELFPVRELMNSAEVSGESFLLFQAEIVRLTRLAAEMNQ